METILEILRGIANAEGLSLWVKAALTILIMVFAGVGGIWYRILKGRARKDRAEREKERDKQQDIIDNKKTEEQHKKDGQSVRDRLRGGPKNGK